MSALERPVPIRAADLAARKITRTLKGPGNEAHSSTQNRNSTIYIHNTYRGGSWRQRADGNGPYISRTGNWSRVSGAM